MADFNEAGFLADDLTEWRQAVHAAFNAAFGIAYRMNEMGMRMLWEIPTECLSESQAWAVAGYARAIETFQSCIVLAERGALAEARALARLCAETVIVTAGLLKIEGTLELLHEDGAKHELAVCNRILELNADRSDVKLERFRAKKAEINAMFKDPRSLKIAALAEKLGLTVLYELSYRLTSGDGAHATLAAFRRHMAPGESGHLEKFVFRPDASDLRSTLLSANAAMVQLIGLAVDYMGLKSYEAETRDLILHWKVVEPELVDPDY